MVNVLVKQLTFSAAHYLPGHPKCGAIHGHTFIIRNLYIEVKDDVFLDFGEIKKRIMDQFDHMFFVPQKDSIVWEQVRDLTLPFKPFVLCIYYTKDSPTCEVISAELKKLLMSLNGVKYVRFELYEGLNQGVLVC